MRLRTLSGAPRGPHGGFLARAASAPALALAVAPAIVLAVALAGCGQASGQRTPDLGQLPLVKGTHVVAQVRECDPGANDFCAVEAVVVGPRYRSSTALMKSERLHLTSLGWSTVGGDTGQQTAAESPGHKLRLTYATAYGDLEGIDLGWIKRPPAIQLALSRALFDRSSAMSIMLEQGPT
jgi:hypothetical protein